MANTTNFGWETPDDTDLVKDGAAAIRTLGSAIDTSLVDLKGGTTDQVLAKNSNTDMDFKWVTSDDANAIQNAIVDAKGDLITATGADTPARLAVGTNEYRLVADSAEATGLKYVADTTNYAIGAKGDLLVGTAADTLQALPVGTNNYVLTAASGETTGLKWSAPASVASNYSLLNAGGTALTGASTITVSGISGQEKLHIIVDSASSANASSAMSIRINTDSGTNYYYGGIKWKADSSEYMLAELTNSYRTNTDSIYLGQMGSNAAMQMGISLFIDGGTATGGKGFIGQGGRSGTQSGTTGVWTCISGVYLGSAAITSISILSSSGNFDNGTIYVYGSAA